MSTTWLDDIDTDSGEYDDSEGGEGGEFAEYDDSAVYDTEANTADQRRRQAQARQRRVALARRRQVQAQARARTTAARRPMPTQRPTQQATVAAIRNLDLETKVQQDTFRSVASAQDKRMSRAEYAAVAGAAVNQFIETFETPENPFAKAALRFAPLLLLSPQKRGTGVEAFIKDPRVLGAATVGAIVIIGENRKQGSLVRRIDVLDVGQLREGESDQFIADAFDGRGNPVSEQVSWKSSNPATASIDEDTGDVTAKQAGRVVITARVGNVVRRVRLTVTSDTGGNAPARVGSGSK